MRAQEIRLTSLLRQEQQFQVPLYQRPFSWLEKDWDRLWNNILEQADGVADGRQQSPHFMGSIVLARPT